MNWLRRWLTKRRARIARRVGIAPHRHAVVHPIDQQFGRKSQ